MNKTPYIVCFLCILLAFATNVSAKGQFNVRNVGVEHGLSQGSVFKIFQDKQGFVWSINENNLDVYDGYRFKPFSGGKAQLTNSYVSDAIQDAEGLFWLSYTDHGVYTYNPFTNEILLAVAVGRIDNKGTAQLVEGINQDILFYTPTGLYSIDKQSHVITSVVERDFGEYHLVMKRFNQFVFLGHSTGIHVIDLASGQLLELPKIIHPEGIGSELTEEANRIFALEIAQNVLYIGTNAGVFSLSLDSLVNADIHSAKFTYKTINDTASVWQFADTDKGLYIASEQGLYLYDKALNQASFLFSMRDLDKSISDARVMALFEDHMGQLWLSSNSSGLYVWQPESEDVEHIGHQQHQINGLQHHDVWAIAQSPMNENEIWVATSHGLTKTNRETKVFRHYFQNLSNQYLFDENYIFDIGFVTPTQLLVVQGTGGFLFDTQSHDIFDMEQVPEINALLRLENYQLDFSDVGVWLMTQDAFYQIDFINKSYKTHRVNVDKKQGHSWNFLGQYQSPNQYLVSSERALFLYDSDSGSLTELFRDTEVVANQWYLFNQFYVDDNQQLWLASNSRGVYVLSAHDYRLIKRIDRASHGIDNNIYGLLPDQDGDLWIATHFGLYSVKVDDYFVRYFGKEDGFIGIEYNEGANTVLANGEFAFGSTEGVAIFDPLTVKSGQVTKRNYTLQIADFDILSREASLPRYVKNHAIIPLNYEDVGIRIDFTSFDFVYREKQKYLFELQGNEPIVFPATFDNYVTFPRLSSGKHTLKVSVVSPTSGEVSEPFYLHFDVSFSPWQSPAAYVLYFIALIALFALYHFRRKKRQYALLKAHEEVKYRENRLQLALKGSNSDVWDWQASDDMLFSKRINRELGYKFVDSAYSFSQHLELIHPQDKAAFFNAWQKFVSDANTIENFSSTYRLKAADGQWLWFKDLGKIVALDQYGKAKRITGSYTNITETRAEEERAQFYGAAFAQTTDWVAIISHDLRKVTANQAIRDVFGWQQEEVPMELFISSLPPNKSPFYQELIIDLKPGENWRGEELLTLNNGKEYHVLINITVGQSHVDNKPHYVCLITDITAQKKAEKELRYMANYDHLTGLPNRSLLLDRIEHAMQVAVRHHSNMALLFIDLDKFKQVNDSLGHDYGDLLLKVVTGRLKNALRKDDTVARLGGDEFVVLIEEYGTTNDIARIAQNIIESLASPITIIEHMVTIGASIGIAVYPDNAQDSSELLRSADIAMYHAKQSGRNHFQFFTERMNAQVAERVQQETQLKLAVQEGSLVNYYQPIIDLRTEEAIGVELLLRWPTNPVMNSPATFIPMAEELGLIVELTLTALDDAFENLTQWRRYQSNFYLSLNVSPTHFNDNSLISHVANLLKHYQLPGSALKVEVTESAFIEKPEQVIATMEKLSALGIELALDDFGTGYSSLAYLKQLPLDILKIDRSFVAGIGNELADQAIVDATLVLADSLKMRCIAEGVETIEQANYLREKSCFFVQGFLFSKPVTADEISVKLSTEVSTK